MLRSGELSYSLGRLVAVAGLGISSLTAAGLALTAGVNHERAIHAPTQAAQEQAEFARNVGLGCAGAFVLITAAGGWILTRRPDEPQIPTTRTVRL